MHRIGPIEPLAPEDETVGPEPHMPHRVRIQHAAVALLAGLVVLTSTRNGPILSPDSITYISAAESLRSLAGFIDFTGEPLTHFPPIFPLLLVPGGRSLLWASIIGVICSAAIAVLLYNLFELRVRSSAALVGTALYVLSQAAARIESMVWSETPYLMFALATMYVLSRQSPTTRSAAAAGILAGLCFLTRYAGAGLVLTGLVMVIVATMEDKHHLRRCTISYLTAPAALASLWIARNLFATGEPLGPHFEGGAGESLPLLARRTARAFGRLVIDLDTAGSVAEPAGFVVLIGLLVAAIFAFRRNPRNTLDVGMATFAVMSIVLPVVSRAVAGTDVSARLLSPTLIPVVYFAVVAINRISQNKLLLGLAAAGALVWSAHGIDTALHGPDRLGGSAANPQFSSQLYPLVADLPPDANVLTNNPQRLWWSARRFPVSFAFTQPKAGNSHFPLSPTETVRRACSADAYLAWFSELDNAGGVGPAELRPDLAALITLVPVESVPGGQLFELAVNDRVKCR